MGGNDTIVGHGTASGDASVGHDTFTGVNAVTGSNFADTITSGHQDDILTGGNGADTFIFERSPWVDYLHPIPDHTITDFTAGDAAGHDVIQFQHFLLADFTAVQAASQQVGADVVITVGPHYAITLAGVDLHALTAADFHFV